jgi:hypothetical protein
MLSDSVTRPMEGLYATDADYRALRLCDDRRRCRRAGNSAVAAPVSITTGGFVADYSTTPATANGSFAGGTGSDFIGIAVRPSLTTVTHSFADVASALAAGHDTLDLSPVTTLFDFINCPHITQFIPENCGALHLEFTFLHFGTSVIFFDMVGTLTFPSTVLDLTGTGKMTAGSTFESFAFASIPEPATSLLLGCAVGFAVLARRLFHKTGREIS